MYGILDISKTNWPLRPVARVASTECCSGKHNVLKFKRIPFITTVDDDDNATKVIIIIIIK
jgi:hypothetical protein